MAKVLEVPEQVGAEFLTQKVKKLIKVILRRCGMEQARIPFYCLISWAIREILIYVLHKLASVVCNWIVVKFFLNKSVYIYLERWVINQQKWLWLDFYMHLGSILSLWTMFGVFCGGRVAFHFFRLFEKHRLYLLGYCWAEVTKGLLGFLPSWSR